MFMIMNYHTVIRDKFVVVRVEDLMIVETKKSTYGLYMNIGIEPNINLQNTRYLSYGEIWSTDKQFNGT